MLFVCALAASLLIFTAHADEVAEASYGAGPIAVEEDVALFEKLVDSTIKMADGLSHELFYCSRSNQCFVDYLATSEVTDGQILNKDDADLLF